MFREQLDRVHIAQQGRLMKRRVVLAEGLAAKAQIRLGQYQQLDDLVQTTHERQVQRRGALDVGQVRARLVLEQQPHEARVTGRRILASLLGLLDHADHGQVQRGLVGVVELLDLAVHFLAPLPRMLAVRPEAVRVHRCAMGQELLTHGEAAGLGGNVDGHQALRVV